jgi:class 3 adenylate cyclase
MEEIVDIRIDEDSGGASRRRLLRIVLPIAFVVLMMAAVLGIAVFSYTSNRRDALALSDDLLFALEQRIATEVRAFLKPASDLVQITHHVLKEVSFDDSWMELAERLVMQMLGNTPQVAIFSFADANGNFVMFKKMADGAVHTKLIEDAEGERNVVWIRRDPTGRVIGRENVPDDDYDPRTRPWYVGAAKVPGVFWTEAYVFFTDQIPGITAAIAFRTDEGEVTGVVGVDIELASLSAFLSGLRIGENGRAMIVDESGQLVASPDLSRMLQEKNGEPVARRLNELGDPVLERAFNRFRLEGAHRRELMVQGRTYINTVSPLAATVGKEWFVLILAPEEDFVGFVSSNNRNTLLMSFGVLALASILAGLLIWQGLRADRNARELLARRREMETQSRAFTEMASNPAIFDPGDTKNIEHATRVVAETLGLRRVSVWQLSPGGRQLICSQCYDRESDGHTRGTRLLQEDMPQLFEALHDGDSLAIPRAIDDPRTSELYRIYLHPIGCRSLLSHAIRVQDQLLGVLWLEDEGAARHWSTGEISFAQALAGLLALRLGGLATLQDCLPAPGVDEFAGTRQAPSAGGGRLIKTTDDLRPTGVLERRKRILRQHIEKQEAGRFAADIYENATVMVLRFTDVVSLAERPEDTVSSTALDQLVCSLEALLDENRIEYLHFLGTQLVCAAGLQRDARDAAETVSELALELQQMCTNWFADRRVRPSGFFIGLDTGAVIGTTVGRKNKVYHLWGDAVRTAEDMCTSAAEGAIQVTESTYRGLQDRFLFKLRGSYYLPDVGEMTTYVLTGRL